MVRDVTIDDIDRVITEARLTFVDCWAPWCKPCLELAVILDELSERYEDNPNVAFVKINVQEYQEFSIKNDIYAIPCTLVYYEGEPASFVDPSGRLKDKKTDRLVGRRPSEHFVDVIGQLL